MGCGPWFIEAKSVWTFAKLRYETPKKADVMDTMRATVKICCHPWGKRLSSGDLCVILLSPSYMPNPIENRLMSLQFEPPHHHQSGGLPNLPSPLLSLFGPLVSPFWPPLLAVVLLAPNRSALASPALILCTLHRLDSVQNPSAS